MIDKLEYDILDEHRYYAYDHFWDNCTTRVRDILDDVTGGALSLDDRRRPTARRIATSRATASTACASRS